MDINNLLRGVGTPTSKGLSQPESAPARKSTDSKDSSTPVSTSETVTLTDTTNRLRQLSQNAAQQPEVNGARVAQLKAALADGSYKIQPSVIAARLMAFEAVLQR